MAATAGPRFPAPSVTGMPVVPGLGGMESFPGFGAPVPGQMGGATLSGLYDGKRMRKAVNRKTVDYNAAVIRHLQVSSLQFCCCRISANHIDAFCLRAPSSPSLLKYCCFRLRVMSG